MENIVTVAIKAIDVTFQVSVISIPGILVWLYSKLRYKNKKKDQLIEDVLLMFQLFLRKNLKYEDVLKLLKEQLEQKDHELNEKFGTMVRPQAHRLIHRVRDAIFNDGSLNAEKWAQLYEWKVRRGDLGLINLLKAESKKSRRALKKDKSWKYSWDHTIPIMRKMHEVAQHYGRTSDAKMISKAIDDLESLF